GWRAAVEHVRQGLRDAVAGAHPDQAALLPALVVGDTTLMSATLKQDFKATGLTHLTAVSGANLTILLAFLLGCARAVGVRGRVLNVIALAGVAAFVVLCHSEPSVLRAAAMGLVGLAALGHSARPGLGLRHLCAAVIALVWIDPWLACSFGFALSVLACAGLLVWGRPWTEALARWLPRWAAEAVAVPLAAQLATQPVVAYLSGAVSLTGLIANALAGPCVAPATVAGLVTALAAALWAPLGAVVGRAAAWTVEPILQIARRAAALPGATHTWPADPLGLAALGLVCLLTAGLLPRLLRRRWASVAAALVLVVALLRPPYQPGWPPDGWTVVACDVGQGDAVAVRVADKAVLLLDVGPPDAGLATCLGSLGVDRVALVVLSHLHSDHVGGLEELLAGWPVGAVLVGPGLAASVTLDPARAAGVEVVTAEEDTVYTVGDAAVEVIAAPPAPAAASADTGESSAENDASLLVRVTAGGLTLLATGDLEATGQSLAVARHPDLAADILKVPHHGSASQDEAFLEATHATLAVISVGAANDYGHPAAATVTTLSRLGMTVLRTDAHGAIAIAKENNTLTITTQR
ncbi:MAG: ComEC/Rec2 family competence protein, partial [Propionibacteriaceae bacterium]|nr:ComEC/Rec2 family competence protein [Propionibacteriaceae bacterium]